MWVYWGYDSFLGTVFAYFFRYLCDMQDVLGFYMLCYFGILCLVSVVSQYVCMVLGTTGTNKLCNGFLQ